ncbi:solute carrier family 39 (zinc transporter), member 1/2/3 [Tremella mesenterica]|uniref:Solute carrier family 39 (Zinc transporter), member 1/2/3 n=1 Tax=Tremella mesenterica TaxID=5217 RepID=A0A4Q1BMK4_TREME|nr:solute carrier family 39 (zinc transporter), member 1/2/3 [Tremella mesenterica]
MYRDPTNPRFAKFFGSGVIIATAFIHLLAPAFDELGSECLSGTWTEYDWAPAFAMLAVYCIFFAEVAAYRIGSTKLAKLNIQYSAHMDDDSDAHAHSHVHEPPSNVDTSGPHDEFHTHPSNIHEHSTSPQNVKINSPRVEKNLDVENGLSTETSSESDTVNQMASKSEAVAQLIAVAVLEFGVILHSIIIGLTLAVNDQFTILFIVIIFHQMFEGLGLGSRLSALILPRSVAWSRYAAAVLYSICTPIGVAVGLGVRESYNGNGIAANITSGILDALSAGILLYTGLVELLGHEILFNPRMMKSSNLRLTYIFVCILLGSGLMALLGRWA